jgi:alkanesulfonate monooxygenase SsuD/methylene tetrahydromethanopterin reductase-like flavin-dependent oxidoreductase (luciferase family)
VKPLEPQVSIGIKASPAGVEWSKLDEWFAAVGAEPLYGAVWLADHLTDSGAPRGGPGWEALTTVAALAHRVPGRWIGIGVLSNTFRHPSVLAKQATVLDHATAGRFILGIGAGWHEGEHDQLGIDLPPLRERFDRFESSLQVLRALFSDAARRPPGVTLETAHARLNGATNEPPTIRPGGPPIFHGGQKPRGLALAGRYGDGWVLPMGHSGDLDYWRERRDAIRRAMDEVGRDFDREFVMVAQVQCGTTDDDRRIALERLRALAVEGAGHLVLGVSAALGPEGIDAVTREVAEPLAASI